MRGEPQSKMYRVLTRVSRRRRQRQYRPISGCRRRYSGEEHVVGIRPSSL